MGIILSRFRKKKTTLQILEGLEERIKSYEKHRMSTEQEHRTIVGHLVLYSVALYVVAAVLFYFCFFPASLYDQLLYITPLLLFPLIVVLLKRLVSWWYCRKLRRQHSELAAMRSEKKQLLEEVMDKETYKVARQILEQFAPDQLRKNAIGMSPPGLAHAPAGHLMVPRPPGGPNSPPLSVASADGLRRRTVPPSGAVAASASPPGLQPLATSTPGGSPRAVPGHLLASAPPNGRPGPLSAPGNEEIGSGETQGTEEAAEEQSGEWLPGLSLPPGPPMPRPVLPRERTVMDRMVEYLVGDGPANRYALVCSSCCSHNGMALKEEFEYLSFRCCYCYHWNPARKQRPHAPRLESEGVGSAAHSPGSTSSSELESGESSSSEDKEEQGGGEDGAVTDGAVKGSLARAVGENGDSGSLPSEDKDVRVVSAAPGTEVPVLPPPDGKLIDERSGAQNSTLAPSTPVESLLRTNGDQKL